ncbi:PREDICTED: UPF0725 protein At3g44770-like isoform X2 [Camelina sativa]|uniref:UPF0725 protein At3g44770-like n=1 Tax=Camelina sativa TaxID=90675 RepID=A0ABM0T7I5_CAMSA|nr:PREDICTED: UPF0725 protein At3g44770-like [Camelina sativa]XP_010422042.1 PREDICTED: UPF0725 protein At3g44770-like isoform X2 [Camelina sativa]
MADILLRMLESGELTDEQCLSMLRVLNSGGCTSEKKVIEEKAVKRIDNRKPLKQLLEMRNLSDEECGNLLREMDEDQSESEEVDERYFRQMIDSQFFDIDPDVRVPRAIGLSHFYFGEEQEPPPEMDLYGQLAVHWFNFENNRNLKFLRIPKLNTQHPFSVSCYITVEVKDEDEDVDATVEVEDVDAAEDEDVDAAADSSPSSLTLQTMVTRYFGDALESMMEVAIEGCRFKPTTTAYKPRFQHFMFNRVDAFYRGCMPTFLSGPPEEAADDQRFYEVQDEDIRKNDWLRLYTQFALFPVCEAGSHAFPPKELELKKILVQTRVTTTQYDDDDDDDDDDVDDEPPSPILNSIDAKSKNAIFHISFRANCRDYTSVVRRTVDGVSGHMQLEVNTTETDCFSSSTDDQS